MSSNECALSLYIQSDRLLFIAFLQGWIAIGAVAACAVIALCYANSVHSLPDRKLWSLYCMNSAQVLLPFLPGQVKPCLKRLLSES